jgi:uncharacterized protein YecE (DUF72 family)
MSHRRREHERKSDIAIRRPISAGRRIVLGTTSTPSARQNLGVSESRRVEGHPVLRVGCPMWAHAPWVGRFLSPSNRGNELAEYSGWCNAVEGNTTFYATPRATTIERWAKQSPTDFRFAFKVPRTITHELRLHGHAARELAVFLRAIEPLGERVGPVQLQLPPSFGPDQLATLRTFVVQLPSSHRWVVELRHPGFFDRGGAHRAVDELLADAAMGRVVLDTRPLYATSPRTDAAVDERRTKPKLPVAIDVMGDEPVVRVIGSDDPEVTFEGLLAWVPPVLEWLAEGRRPYVFVHQPENLDSPALARRFHAAVAAVVADLGPLPTPIPVAPAGETTGQSSLF